MKILFIGTVNKGANPRGGEEFKNQLLVKKLEEDYELKIIETMHWRQINFVLSNLLFQLLFVKYDQIIISASSRSTNFLLTLLYFFPKTKTKVIYFVLGGYFPTALENGIYQLRNYVKLKAIIVQGNGLMQKLKAVGLENVIVLDNFKNFNSEVLSKKYNEDFEIIKFVFIASLIKEKGVDIVFEAVQELINSGYRGRFSVSFYGVKDSEFIKKIAAFQLKEMEYNGYFDFMNNPKENYDILANYHCLVFPTFYIGEGFAGIFIDAFIAGLPLITTDWNMNKEVIKDGVNGIIIAPENAHSLVMAMKSVIDNPTSLIPMAKNARELAPNFHVDKVWNIVKNKIEEKNKKRLLFIGALNLNQSPNGGEEYKNQVFVHKLKSYYDCKIMDTHEWRKNKFIALTILVESFTGTYHSIILSASSKSTYRLIQILSLSKKVLNKISYFVIGGYFPEALNEGIYKVKYYTSLKAIILEGEILKNKINTKQTLSNVGVIPNFKKFDLNLPTGKKNSDLVEFVFLSLITKDKGTDLIFKAAELLIENGYSGKFTISLYGKIDEMYKQEFLESLNTHIKYEGYINIMQNPIDSYQILSNYDCMLFPSYFLGEGFPGVIIDAYIAGLPVIASDWHMNREVIDNGVNGIIFTSKNEIELSKAMERLIENPQLLVDMSINVRKKASEFHIDKVWNKIEKVIEL